MMRTMVAAWLLLGFANAASAQSFDCQKARTPVEKMVCADAGLSELDEHLGRYYTAARAELEGAASCLQMDQARWLMSVRDVCRTDACLEAAYLNRLGELDALQPGVTAIKTVALPNVPALAWVIAPAADKVTAPLNAKAPPLEASGLIVDDVANGDGFLLRTADGTNIPLVLLMFLDGKAPERLAALARQKGVTFRVRGYGATDGTRRYFEPSRCTFIHRLPATAPRGPNDAGEQDQEKQLEKIQKTVLTQGKVCPDPNRPCGGFKPNELSFAINTPFRFDRGADKSQPFYAVILQSGPLCGINDSERIRAQKAFPAAKVFLHRHFCEDFGDKVTYSNVNTKSGFVAVYAGETEADATRVLKQARVAGYAGANLRRMEVIVVYQLE